MNKAQLKDIRVFVCVPGVGKTSLCEQDERFVDMDCIKCRHKYALENSPKEVVENLKGHYGNAVRKDTNEYMEKLTLDMLHNTDKILLFAPNPKMVEMIYRNNIPYCLVYHTLDCVDEYKDRMRKRGNDEQFIENMLGEGVIYNFYKDSTTDTRPTHKIELQRGEYLADKLLEIFK